MNMDRRDGGGWPGGPRPCLSCRLIIEVEDV